MPELQPFVYPEMSWPEDLASVSRRLAEAFPVASLPGARAMAPEGRAKAAEKTGPARQETGVVSGLPDAADDLPFAQVLAEEKVRAEERGRARGVEQGRQSGREEAAASLESERRRLWSQAA